MPWGDHWNEFLEGPKDVSGLMWDVIVGVIVGGIILMLGKATLPVAILFGVLTAAVINTRKATRRLEESTKMLAGITLTADDVLRQVAETDALANGMEQSFRNAAERRAWEADQIKQHGSRTAVHQLTYSGTFESQATQNLPQWNRRFEELSIKMAGLGFRVFPPTEPTNAIAGAPTPEAIKFVCQREALAVAADSLRTADTATH